MLHPVLLLCILPDLPCVSQYASADASSAEGSRSRLSSHGLLEPTEISSLLGFTESSDMSSLTECIGRFESALVGVDFPQGPNESSSSGVPSASGYLATSRHVSEFTELMEDSAQRVPARRSTVRTRASGEAERAHTSGVLASERFAPQARVNSHAYPLRRNPTRLTYTNALARQSSISRALPAQLRESRTSIDAMGEAMLVASQTLSSTIDLLHALVNSPSDIALSDHNSELARDAASDSVEGTRPTSQTSSTVQLLDDVVNSPSVRMPRGGDSPNTEIELADAEEEMASASQMLNSTMDLLQSLVGSPPDRTSHGDDPPRIEIEASDTEEEMAQASQLFSSTMDMFRDVVGSPSEQLPREGGSQGAVVEAYDAMDEALRSASPSLNSTVALLDPLVSSPLSEVSGMDHSRPNASREPESDGWVATEPHMHAAFDNTRTMRLLRAYESEHQRPRESVDHASAFPTRTRLRSRRRAAGSVVGVLADDVAAQGIEQREQAGRHVRTRTHANARGHLEAVRTSLSASRAGTVARVNDWELWPIDMISAFPSTPSESLLRGMGTGIDGSTVDGTGRRGMGERLGYASNVALPREAVPPLSSHSMVLEERAGDSGANTATDVAPSSSLNPRSQNNLGWGAPSYGDHFDSIRLGARSEESSWDGDMRGGRRTTVEMLSSQGELYTPQEDEASYAWDGDTESTSDQEVDMDSDRDRDVMSNLGDVDSANSSEERTFYSPALSNTLRTLEMFSSNPLGMLRIDEDALAYIEQASRPAHRVDDNGGSRYPGQSTTGLGRRPNESLVSTLHMRHRPQAPGSNGALDALNQPVDTPASLVPRLENGTFQTFSNTINDVTRAIREVLAMVSPLDAAARDGGGTIAAPSPASSGTSSFGSTPESVHPAIVNAPEHEDTHSELDMDGTNFEETTALLQRMLEDAMVAFPGIEASTIGNSSSVSHQELLRSAAEREAADWRSLCGCSPATIAALPVAPLSAETGASSGCVICLSEAMQREPKCYLPCRHVFHRLCVGQWLRLQATCPTCRRDVPDTSA